MPGCPALPQGPPASCRISSHVCLLMPSGRRSRSRYLQRAAHRVQAEADDVGVSKPASMAPAWQPLRSAPPPPELPANRPGRCLGQAPSDQPRRFSPAGRPLAHLKTTPAASAACACPSSVRSMRHMKKLRPLQAGRQAGRQAGQGPRRPGERGAQRHGRTEQERTNGQERQLSRGSHISSTSGDPGGAHESGTSTPPHPKQHHPSHL